MSDPVSQIVSDWSLPIWLTLSIALTGAIYIRGWFAIRRTRPEQFTDVRLYSFLSGIALLWIVAASPLDGFADALFTVHMIEHLLLMSVIPLLLLYSLPVVPLLRGLPAPVRRSIAGPLIRNRGLRRVLHFLTKPSIAWLGMNLAYLIWHIPGPFDHALENETIHGIEHLCFFSTSLLFWWFILRPWPAEERRDDWRPILYLALADILMTITSGFLSFCDRPIYPYYVAHPNPFGISILNDQVCGAVVMWVLGSIALLAPAMLITVRLLSPAQLRKPRLNARAQS